jgi:hypothetical protein
MSRSHMSGAQAENRNAEKRLQRQKEEEEMEANPPEEVLLRLKRYQGEQLAKVCQMAGTSLPPGKLTSILLLANPGRQMLPVTRLMCKKADPPLPNKWNIGKSLPQSSFGILFPIADKSLLKTEQAFLDIATGGISALSIHPENITFVIKDATGEPTLSAARKTPS